MAKFKSPGQKRKGIVRIFSFILFLVATYGASLILGYFNNTMLKWVDNHKEVNANVIAQSVESETYRNRKGRERTRDVYYLEYSFKADGEEFFNSVTVDEEQYSNYQIGSDIAVWYAADNPNTSEYKNTIQKSVANNNTVGNMFGVVPYTAPGILFVYWVLTLIFVRESTKVLPEGFYTENSWLDIDDNYIVAIDNTDLVFFDIDAKQTSTVQEAYQNNASIEELIAISKSSKFKRVPINEITAVASAHNSDVFVVTHGEDEHSVEFLNQTVKAHALNALKQHMPTELEYQKSEKTRLQAVVPSLLLFVLLIAIVVLADIFVLNLLLGLLILIKVLPRMVVRLMDPTVTELWQLSEEPERVVSEA